ncbi:hypothetical protein MUY27_18120 [Mucilaginibacter sp. RS28]|uniref:Uncharacterized protein n=1 Tax=Mucilaginibacter straminoryzae TaxID=2932774 RepID=A0A9X1X751_9SPHI|nr:hypothetical protein [Mucilaginibacter straminoryzae]MCJ8211640.1 hypothetical protein [Mucilaginibacter straminoryzae]
MKNVLIYVFLFLSPLLFFSAYAQKDTIIRRSPVKTLTDAQYNAILKGDDVNNTAASATMNGYPLPDKVLKYKKELNLTPAQLKQFDEIMKTLDLKKREVAVSVIRNEKMLDSMFRRRFVNEGSIVFYGNRYGLYQGELRTALLTACFNTRKVLTPYQLNKFYTLEKP